MNKFEVRGMDLYYGSFHALKNINIDIPEKEITAFIGPSGCGKSTFLKSLNRMNDLVEGCRISGDIRLDGVDIYKDKMDVNVLRKRVGLRIHLRQPLCPLPVLYRLRQAAQTVEHKRRELARFRAAAQAGVLAAARRDKRDNDADCHIRRQRQQPGQRKGPFEQLQRRCRSGQCGGSGIPHNRDRAL